MPKTNPPVNKIRTIFMGTPEFSLPGFNALLTAPDLEIVGVFTQPDKPVGRHQTLTPSPVKELALKYGLPIFQPTKLKPEIETIKNLKPDLIVVIAYGKIIPPEILALPTYGCINVHASLLPKYRGAACLNAPILNGDQATGITIMKMEAGLDTGPILRQAKIKLNGQETLVDVHDQLSKLGAELLVQTILDFIAGKIQPQTQDESVASYVKTIQKEDGRIDWAKSATEIERLVRAYNPWPGSYALIGEDDKILKILAVDNEGIKSQKHKIGEAFLDNGKLAIQCGQDALAILKLQLSGGRPSTAAEFLRGHSDFIGKILQ
jgi:methionyl-tRNA formyltransferase